MVKAFAGSTLMAVVLMTGALVGIACSSENDSKFGDDPPKTPAEDGPISPIVPNDAGIEGGEGGEAGPSSCPPQIPATFAPSWKAPAKTSACTTAQLKEYWDACLADAGKTESDGTCAAWKAAAANTACGACAEPDDKSGPIQWHLSRKFYTLNVAGCIEVQKDKPALDECGESFNAAVQCSRESCDFCFGLGGNFDQFRDCQKAVSTEGVCKSYETVASTKCAGYRNAGEPTLLCFPDGSETTESHFTRVVGFLCGP